MGKKKAKGKNKKPAKTKSAPSAELEKISVSSKGGWRKFFSDGWRFPSKWEAPDWSRFSKLKFMTPRVDIVDRDDDILVRADVPGVKNENLDVTLTDNTITIKGKTSEEKKEEKGDYFRSETMKGSFTRTSICQVMLMAIVQDQASRMACSRWWCPSWRRPGVSRST